jgi:hypothetical protein
MDGVFARPGRALALARALKADGGLVAIAAGLVTFWAFAAPSLLQADSWLTLLGGREIAAHGLPRSDALAVVTQGRPWVDQQWLAQLFFWRLTELGGLRLDLLVTVGLLAAALVLALREARLRGGSAVSIAPFALLPVVVFTSFLRAQLFSQLLFVLTLALLCQQSRSPSRRVWLVFPLLVLWANLHGAAIVGAALVSLLGACELAARRRRMRALGLLIAPWFCLLATPYGLAIGSYYRSTLANPLLRRTITEWQAPTLASATGLALLALAAAALALVVKRPSDVNRFEQAALAATLAAALLTVRSITWFAYSCLILLPPLLERVRPHDSAPTDRSRWSTTLAASTSVLALTALTLTAVGSTSRLTRHWPDDAQAAVATVLRQDPNARVLANSRYADWLLYRTPQLRGRTALDGRWELLRPDQAQPILNYFWQTGTDWEQASRGYRLLVLDPQTQAGLVATYDKRLHTRTLYRDPHLVVYDRGPAADGQPALTARSASS